MKKRINVAILGAAGVLGQRFIERLENHPTFEIAALADIMVDKRYEDATKWRLGTSMPSNVKDTKIVSNASLSPKDVDLVFSALPGGIAAKIETDLATKGFFIISKASDHRMEEDVPLIIPEVNANHLSVIEEQKKKRGWRGAIVTDPNCSTTILAMSLKPLWDHFGIESVVVSTMQSLSGAGYPGVPSLDILDNVVPYIGGEEEKMVVETKKLLGNGKEPAKLKVSACCNRVATLDGHMEDVFVATKKKVEPAEAKKAFLDFKGLDYPSAPRQPIIVRDEPDRPQTRLDRDAGNGMSVVLGRLREDEVMGLTYTVVGHNTIRGGAGGAVLVGELCHGKGYI
ncbi:MAG: aspartate-semialdehyde dehydrogenase [Candidatus Bathyarchaeia archaeon]